MNVFDTITNSCALAELRATSNCKKTFTNSAQQRANGEL